MKNSKGITLIVLVITIVVLLILATITIRLTLGENGVIRKAKEAILMNKKAEYLQEIESEIVGEQMERLSVIKDEPFIVSLQKRLQGTESASQEYVKVYTKKPWVDRTEINLNKVLVVYTVEKYQLLVDVDNQNNTAAVRQNSFTKKGKECTVTFDGNSGTGNIDSISITEGLGILLPENSFTKTNYTFVGWYKNAEGEGERYNEGEEYTVTDDETLYAKWSQHAIEITYSAGAGTGTQMASTTIEIGETDNLLANTYTKVGYTFVGWKDQDNNTYTNQQEITASKDLQLTAQWEIIEYTIGYTLNDGTVEIANPTTYTVETPTFTLNNPSKDGYDFTGWTGTNLTGDENTTVTIANGSIGNRSYTANWMQTGYTLVSMVNVGDYVDINVGYVDQMNGTDYTTATNIKKAWRVLSKNETTGVVNLISTGHPLKFEHNSSKTATQSLTEMNKISTETITVDASNRGRLYRKWILNK